MVFRWWAKSPSTGQRIPQVAAGRNRVLAGKSDPPALRDKRALLILDNAEGLTADELDWLLPCVPGPVTVLTCRHAFPALERLGRPLRVDVMSEEETPKLLGWLVGRRKVEGGLPRTGRAAGPPPAGARHRRAADARPGLGVG